ncbi:MAG: UbiX family flavin prenyltransferase [Bdellovibrionales bacterium]|nr:UbiX family flavin prenyltransferase [Bdellovibrionales bacterium]
MNSSQTAAHRWVIGITGASGTVYARRMVQAMLENEPLADLHVIFSDAALRVMREEEGISTSINRIDVESLFGPLASDRITTYSNRDIGASIASGSFRTRGMVIVPCSMATLAAVACGYCDKLIHRAADVVLKEQRRLIIVPRETPLSSIHLENMLKLVRAGASMVPAMPGFYHQPASIEELVDMQVMKILDVMGYEIDLVQRWKGGSRWPLGPAESQSERKRN